MYYTVKPLKKFKPCNDNGCAEDRLTADELLIIRRMITGEHVTLNNSGIEEDAWSKLMTRIGK